MGRQGRVGMWDVGRACTVVEDCAHCGGGLHSTEELNLAELNRTELMSEWICFCDAVRMDHGHGFVTVVGRMVDQ